ncbi:hypothetical protein A0O34_04090 [Chryseobacterium glaciei]|uniref:DUF4303 domain-containing protein n=1 Tax=Chryseobacterium glaciei TaxID=1685010 RepID=A0A172XSB2_9FLAO|nr:hypothetical protein [Chryseobacterium glaciei]ANF49770.1 hypothetical protein A0O34_04090 [Chryseobacterium glaciei]
MVNLKSLNIELKKYLEEKISPMLIVELTELVNDKNINYLNNKSKADTKALYFEYRYDYLNIIFWAVDQEGERITEIIKLPSKEIDIINESDDWDALIPEKIWVTVTAFEDIYEEDDSDDILDEYNTEKYELFENWFLECWKKASEQTEVKTDAYFSIHDTYFKTDLNSMQTINTDEISKRYQ